MNKNKEYAVFQRGQVWYINDNRKNIGSIQGKSRPYLVVSNNACNQSSPVIHMAPITSQEKNNQPTHVEFYDSQRRINQTILVEQVMPKSIPDILPVAEYRYSLSKDKMDEVDRALAVQFGIPYGGIDLSEFESIIDRIKGQKLAEIKAESDKLTAAKAKLFSSELMQAVGSIEVEKVPEELPKATINKPTSTPSQIEKFNTRLSKSNQLQHPTQLPSNNHKQNKWTAERKKEFLQDSTRMPKAKMLEKYHMTSNSYNTTLSKFRREYMMTSHESERFSKANQDAKEYLEFYDSHPVSEVVTKYHLHNNQEAVELAAKYRISVR